MNALIRKVEKERKKSFYRRRYAESQCEKYNPSIHGPEYHPLPKRRVTLENGFTYYF